MARKPRKAPSADIKAAADRAEARSKGKTSKARKPKAQINPVIVTAQKIKEQLKTKKKGVSYSEDVVHRICALIAEKHFLKEICEMPDMPALQTFYKWMAKYPIVGEMYARARAERADLVADECVTIADTDPDPQRARVRIDARKWWAAKVNPKKYGDRQQVDMTVSGSLDSMGDDELARIAASGRSGAVEAPPRPSQLN